MKLYTYIAPKLIRVYIRKQGEESFYLNIEEANQQQVIDLIKEVVTRQNLSPFEVGKVTSCDVRRWENGKFTGKCISVSFKGLSPEQLHKLLTSELTKKNSAFKAR